jgi:hypothetical protein
MNVVDLLVTIVVVTILVTIVLAIVTYIAYKLRLAREPSQVDEGADGLRYFVRFDPPVAGRVTNPMEPGVEGHATEA